MDKTVYSVFSSSPGESLNTYGGPELSGKGSALIHPSTAGTWICHSILCTLTSYKHLLFPRLPILFCQTFPLHNPFTVIHSVHLPVFTPPLHFHFTFTKNLKFPSSRDTCTRWVDIFGWNIVTSCLRFPKTHFSGDQDYYLNYCLTQLQLYYLYHYFLNKLYQRIIKQQIRPSTTSHQVRSDLGSRCSNGFWRKETDTLNYYKS